MPDKLRDMFKRLHLGPQNPNTEATQKANAEKKPAGSSGGLLARIRARRLASEDLPMLRRLRRRLTVVFTALTGMILAAVIGVTLWFAVQQTRANAQEQFTMVANTAVLELVTVSQLSSERITELEQSNDYVVFAGINAEMIDFEPGFEAETERDILLERAQTALVDATFSGEVGDNLFGVVTAVFSAEAVEAQDSIDYEINEDRSIEIFQNPDENDYSVRIQTEAGETYDSILDSRQFFVGGAATNDEDMLADDIYILPYYYAAGSSGFTLNGDYRDEYRGVYTEVYMETYDGEELYDAQHYEILVLQSLDEEKASLVWLCVAYFALLLLGMLLLWLVSRLLARIVTKPTAEGIQQQADFVAAASHELRSPLTVMRSSLSAASVAPDAASSARYRGAAESEAERMSRLIDDLLLLAGGDAGNWRVQADEVDLDTLIIEVHEQFAGLAKKNDNKLLLRLPEETLGTVKGDRDRLHQILSVLLDNAFQYAPTGTGVVLCAKRKKSKVEIEVIDHGLGIPDDQKERVFERFFRADTSRTDKKHFGLGLSVAKELAELHDGKLVVEDTEGGGATVRLTLPIVPDN